MRYVLMSLMLMAMAIFSSVAQERPAPARPGPYILVAKTWKCPMEECKVTGQDKAGRCTVCNMNLVAETVTVFDVVAWAPCGMRQCGGVEGKDGRCPECGMRVRAATVAEVLTWKCPMEECKVTGEKELGKCKVCNMDLVPETLGEPVPFADISPLAPPAQPRG